MRSVKVKTSKGVVCRPIQSLHDLEINSCNNNGEMDDDNDNALSGDDKSFVHFDVVDTIGTCQGDYNPVSYTRVKVPARLDL